VGPPAAISARRITGNSAVTPKFPPGRKAAGAVQEAWKLELPPRRRSPRCRGVLLGLAVLPWYLVGSTAWVQEPPAAGCAAALVSEGQTIDGLPMERWTWAGAGQDLGTLDGHRVVLCEASGPRERLPFQNAIGCMLIDDQAARVGDRLACGAYLTVEWLGNTLLWTAHASAATVQVTPLRWNGDRFSADAPFMACADVPLRPVEYSQQPDCAGPPR
jgi:hypothetical protein